MYFYYNYKDLYDDDTIAVAQKGFKKDICTNRNNDSHCADAGPDENEKTLTMIIEKEDDGKLNKISISGTFTC